MCKQHRLSTTKDIWNVCVDMSNIYYSPRKSVRILTINIPNYHTIVGKFKFKYFIMNLPKNYRIVSDR